VRLNGGRLGARQGPTAFRAALARFGGQFDALESRVLDVQVYDAGDVVPAEGDDSAALEATHDRVEGVATRLHEQGLLPVCIGGGHDLSLPTIRALSRARGSALGGINFDAHLDVRQRVGSGMPFRRLIESGSLDPKCFVELGLGRFVNDQADLRWLSERGARLVFADEVLGGGLKLASMFDQAFSEGRLGFVSIDLDGIDQSMMAGVSATNPLGLSVWHAAQLAEAAGRNPSVQHFDLMELSPEHDTTGASARVAASLFLSFIAGLGARES
jgi:formimidoylglutamase